MLHIWWSCLEVDNSNPAPVQTQNTTIPAFPALHCTHNIFIHHIAVVTFPPYAQPGPVSITMPKETKSQRFCLCRDGASLTRHTGVTRRVLERVPTRASVAPPAILAIRSELRLATLPATPHGNMFAQASPAAHTLARQRRRRRRVGAARRTD